MSDKPQYVANIGEPSDARLYELFSAAIEDRLEIVRQIEEQGAYIGSHWDGLNERARHRPYKGPNPSAPVSTIRQPSYITVRSHDECHGPVGYGISIGQGCGFSAVPHG
jgi:hypothetical protein